MVRPASLGIVTSSQQRIGLRPTAARRKGAELHAAAAAATAAAASRQAGLLASWHGQWLDVRAASRLLGLDDGFVGLVRSG